jgi:hypothetical protein
MATKKIHLKLNQIKDYTDAYLVDYGIDINDWSYDDDRYTEWDYDQYGGTDWYWYIDYIYDPNRIREELIDELLGIITDATFFDILPESIKNPK